MCTFMTKSMILWGGYGQLEKLLRLYGHLSRVEAAHECEWTYLSSQALKDAVSWRGTTAYSGRQRFSVPFLRFRLSPFIVSIRCDCIFTEFSVEVMEAPCVRPQFEVTNWDYRVESLAKKRMGLRCTKPGLFEHDESVGCSLLQTDVLLIKVFWAMPKATTTSSHGKSISILKTL
jgi:hypothetical protein